VCVGGGKHRAEKVHVGVGQLSSPCGEIQALHCLGETRSKLKLKVSPKESFISNPQACSVSGRGWQLLIYQPLMGPLLRTHLLQRPHSTKGSPGSNTRPEPPLKLSIGKSNTHCHATQHTNSKKGQSWPNPLLKKKSPPHPEFRGKSPEHSLN
jgi:hypothetical protein